ncbi:MAG: iron-sulfur cluster assembly accessory protein [Myxococcota bacterium]
MDQTATASPAQPTSADTSRADTTKRPVLTLTAAAVKQLKEVMATQGFADHVVAVRVVPAGCSGLGYDLNLVKEGKPGDLSWQQDGITIVTDAISSKYLTGTEMDYVTSDTASGFKFHNPNAKSSCGCGSSFSA